MVRLDLDSKVFVVLALVMILVIAMTASELRAEAPADEAALRASLTNTFMELQSQNRALASTVSAQLAAEIIATMTSGSQTKTQRDGSPSQLVAIKTLQKIAAGQSDRT